MKKRALNEVKSSNLVRCSFEHGCRFRGAEKECTHASLKCGYQITDEEIHESRVAHKEAAQIQ